MNRVILAVAAFVIALLLVPLLLFSGCTPEAGRPIKYSYLLSPSFEPLNSKIIYVGDKFYVIAEIWVRELGEDPSWNNRWSAFGSTAGAKFDEDHEWLDNQMDAPEGIRQVLQPLAHEGDHWFSYVLVESLNPGGILMRVEQQDEDPILFYSELDEGPRSIEVREHPLSLNHAPVLNGIGNKVVTAGETLTFAISATDANVDPLTFSALNLPFLATFNLAIRTFSWTPTSSHVGEHNVRFVVSDGTLEDSETITIIVNAPPVTSIPPSPTVTLPATTTTRENPVVLSDDFTLGTEWTTAFTTTDPNITQTANISVKGGNDGGYRRMEHIMSFRGSITVYHYFSVSYDPSQGAIDHINYYEDHIEILPPYTGAAIGWGFFLEQAGTRYTKRIENGAFKDTSWQSVSMVNLTAADFPGVDFSTSGKPIKFGFYRSNTNTGGVSYNTTHGIDNWKVEIFRK